MGLPGCVWCGWGGRELLASAGDDATVRLWDPATRHPLHLIPVHYEALALMSFADGHLIHGGQGWQSAVRV